MGEGGEEGEWGDLRVYFVRFWRGGALRFANPGSEGETAQIYKKRVDKGASQNI